MPVKVTGDPSEFDDLDPIGAALNFDRWRYVDPRELGSRRSVGGLGVADVPTVVEYLMLDDERLGELPDDVAGDHAGSWYSDAVAYVECGDPGLAFTARHSAHWRDITHSIQSEVSHYNYYIEQLERLERLEQLEPEPVEPEPESSDESSSESAIPADTRHVEPTADFVDPRQRSDRWV